MEENWIKMNKHVLFYDWLIPKNCNLVKKLSKRRSFKLI